MELQQLIHFQRAAQLNNMSKAARELHITQPALSKSIAGLEEELGVQLFDRRGKKITLNDTGEEILSHVNRIEAECEAMRRTAFQKRPTREIRLLAKAADQLIPDIVFEINREHPEIHITVSHYQSHHEPDIVITSSLETYDQPDGMTVLKEDFVLVVPRDHFLAELESVTLQDLDREPLILLGDGIPLRDIEMYWLKKARVHISVSFECDSCVMMRELINNGKGIGLVPSRTWSFSYNPAIRILPITGEECYRYVNVICAPQRYEKEARLVYQSVTSYLKGFYS